MHGGQKPGEGWTGNEAPGINFSVKTSVLIPVGTGGYLRFGRVDAEGD